MVSEKLSLKNSTISQISMAAISVDLVYKGLKIAQIVQINQLFHRSNSICA